MKEFRSLLVSVVSLFFTQVLSTCYNPDGTPELEAAYKPCIAFDGAKTMCCALNRTNPSGGLLSDGWTRDNCLWNGLCENVVNTTNDSGDGYTLEYSYWRDQCWTSDWNSSGNCLNYCMGQNVSSELRLELRVSV